MNCETCEHKQNPQGGYCYMFEREPAICRAHTQGLSAGAIGSVQKAPIRLPRPALKVVCAPEKQDREADLESAGHRLALELECLLMDTKDMPTVSRWWETAHEALAAWQALHEYNGPRLEHS